MRRFKHKTVLHQFLPMFLLPLLLLSTVGVVYSHWSDYLYFNARITTGSWGGGSSGACVEIQKTLSGAFTDPLTGKDTSIPIDLIRVGSNSLASLLGDRDCLSYNFPTKFKLCINVTNCGLIGLTDVVVIDRLEHIFININQTSSDTEDSITWSHEADGKGGVKSKLVWEIGELPPGESANLCIWVMTTQNPAEFYHPTSANSNYTINMGAKVFADSEIGSLNAQTEGITLEIGDFVEATIAKILTGLPYSTSWASDHIEN